MIADWAVIIATLGMAVLILTPAGRRLGIWAGSDDPTAGVWDRFYGRPSLGFFVVGATYFAVLAGRELRSGRPWSAALLGVLVLIELIGCALHVYRRRQGRTPQVM